MSVPIIGYTSTLKFFDVKIKKQIIYQNSNKTFHFSDKVYTLLTCVNIPTNISAKEITTESDVINNDIPLLFSKDAKKRANTVINLKKNEVSMFDKERDLKFTSTRYYAVPINRNSRVAYRKIRQCMCISLTFIKLCK